MIWNARNAVKRFVFIADAQNLMPVLSDLTKRALGPVREFAVHV